MFSIQYRPSKLTKVTIILCLIGDILFQNQEILKRLIYFYRREGILIELFSRKLCKAKSENKLVVLS